MMLIELLWRGVCRAVLSLDQNGIENVLILINYSTGRQSDCDSVLAGPHQRSSPEACRRWKHTNVEVYI